MVFKGRFFSSKKSSDSDGSNSPRRFTSAIKIDKKKAKSDDHLHNNPSKLPINSTTKSNNNSPTSTSTSSSSSTKQSVSSKIKNGKGKETQIDSSSKPNSNSPSASVSPILASSLGLNKIKTRSGPLPQESFLGFRSDKTPLVLGSSNLSKAGISEGSGKKDMGWLDNVTDSASNSDSMSPESGGRSTAPSPNLSNAGQLPRSRLSSGGVNLNSLWEQPGGVSPVICTPEGQMAYGCETPKESESPRFQAILRVTSGPQKRYPADIKSFSHELNSKGVRPFPLWKPRGLNNLEEVLVMIRGRFEKAKEEVDSDLAIFAADLVGLLEKNTENYPRWQETIEDLLILARRCAMTSPNEFWLQCESIVQELDDRRQELPPGKLKQLHTRMLFILTRCTRLLQFHKESGLAEDGHALQLRESTILQFAEKRIPTGKDRKISVSGKISKVSSAQKSFSQEHRGRNLHSSEIFLPTAETTKSTESPSGRERIASWKKLPSPVAKKTEASLIDLSDTKLEHLKISSRRETPDADPSAVKVSEVLSSKDPVGQTFASSNHQHQNSWGYWGDQPSISDENSIICRICEELVPTLHVEDHSRICAIADRCDQKGLSVNERLLRIAETLEKMTECPSQKDFQPAVGSPDAAKVSNSSVTEESDVFSPKLSDWSRRGSEDMLDSFPDADNAAFVDDFKGLSSMSCKTRFGPKSDQGMTTSSAGSMTPRSPLLTPRDSPIDLLLSGKGGYSEHEDHPQMAELADIARCSANALSEDDHSMNYLLTCLEDLSFVIGRRKFDALTVETFGARIEKLIREKYLQLVELVDTEKIDLVSTVIDEDAPLEDDVVRSLRTSPIHSSKDRTSIDDFEIIKPISRGAFGRVFLAKKRTTGDLFAIKVLKKADMIRKNAVESILAERNILISVRNPFVVRFFYSFTCRENLYLVMEYLNGGDLYSLLRNLGCLDEDVARVYIAEVVLALEYLHSLQVVHRDLKPDNLLIAHDGHIKLTDFGLSKVGLINSTDDLSGPAVSGTSLFEDDQPQLSASEKHQERRKKRSAVGTPDYLAPEILLGTGHGATADWWSVGVILFELIVGIPPFNAEHPQIIFDNILNRNIPWPRVPEEMSCETQDLINKLLTEDPNQRLGARGASEVKAHPFFRDINWDTLARQKAAFVPSSDGAYDTSYFTSRYSWNHSDDHVNAACEFEDNSDDGTASGSSGYLSDKQEELGDECSGLAEFESGFDVNYSFSNFSFKNLSQLASINYDLLSKGWKDDPPPNSNV
ncbi:probable serine/threonine protein kinase IREH1 [Amaranthus tricolor]|uniref:probable serine/threonine protein kinase IREH1 n=1 Tax=Amaranthus tricolor TaxID=29722 RepID=UPI002590F785|nr:probable serine/threonine protein kinase IREH1 [Amaranthus tricolor]